MGYDIFEHRHRFSCWAAARAAQRKWKGATVDILRQAVESCGVVEFLKADGASLVNEEKFDECHKQWCVSAVHFLERKGVPNISFGRAAKLIAVYLKSMVVLGPNWNTSLARVAHPPIDRILLQNMSSSPEIVSPHKSLWRYLNWTELDEPTYYWLICDMKRTLTPGEPFWTLERFWTVTDE